MHVGIVRSELQGSPIARDCLVVFLEAGQGNAQAVVRIGRIRGEADGRLEASRRFVEFFQRCKRVAQMESDLDAVGPAPHKLAQNVGQLVVPFLAEKELHQRWKGHRMIGVQADGSAKARCGLVHAPQVAKDAAEVVVDIGDVGVEGTCTPETRERLVVPALLRQHDPQVRMRGEKVGARINRPQKARFRVAQPAEAKVGHGQKVPRIGILGVGLEDLPADSIRLREAAVIQMLPARWQHTDY